MRARELMPPGMGIAGVDVSGLNREAAAARVTEQYFSPIYLIHKTESVPINPADVGFTIDIDGMMEKAETYKAEQDVWRGFVEFLLDRPLAAAQIELRATHDRDTLMQQVQTVADILDEPAVSPQFASISDSYEAGQVGFVTDVAASLPDIEAALYRPVEREAELVVVEQEATALSMDLLKENIERQLQGFDGIGSVFVLDLETGEEIGINADMAISGLSILKIGIFLETYRVLDGPPNEYVQNLLHETAVRSSNFDANLLLHVIAGADNTYLGAELLTKSFEQLGLVNTFMAIPYDAPVVASRPSTFMTPANSRPDLITIPDPARQTTAEDMGTLLSMIYYCSKGGGALMAIHPGEITQQECQAIIDLMVENVEGNLIRFGVPEDVPVSHKHGWDSVTHGDAGIVLSPGRDYVIVYYLHQPQSDFLVSEYSFPILWDISRAAYNYFNYEHPNTELPQDRAEREAAARAAAEAAAEEAAAEEGEGVETAVPDSNTDEQSPTDATQGN
ncbi:MAG: serine hydrolase [Anaerolineales bacterium]|nr:serine hydrolase [Anaerolineales bacterium]MCA9931209.1 serine hydrolase [Anaerolineales bacterium]